MIVKKCLICDKEFLSHFSAHRKYCSRKCAYQSPIRSANISKKMSGENHPFWHKKRPEHSAKMKGSNNPKYKGRVMKGGYIMIYCPNHPFRKMNIYIFEHRLIAEKYLGRYLKPIEAIHHINEIKTDNRIENLYLFSTRWSHSIYHALLRSNPELVKKILKSNLF